MKAWHERTLYELLEVDPSASQETVRQAIQRSRRELAPTSVALYSILSNDERELLMERLDEAQRMLTDPVTRREYDRSIGLDPQASASQASSAATEPHTVAGAPAGDGEITGAVLAAAREARGLTVDRLATVTRIRRQILDAIESEDSESLPQKVFVRGFVVTYAREVGLDPDQAWHDLAPRLGFDLS